MTKTILIQSSVPSLDRKTLVSISDGIDYEKELNVPVEITIGGLKIVVEMDEHNCWQTSYSRVSKAVWLKEKILTQQIDYDSFFCRNTN